MYKPPRSHFDSITQRLVLNMDHFCPWVFLFFSLEKEMRALTLSFCLASFHLSLEQNVPPKQHVQTAALSF